MNQNARCTACDKLFDLQWVRCPDCKLPGFVQQPMTAKVGELDLHLEEILTHVESTNKFKIKEIQLKGLICKVFESPLGTAVVGKVAYISNIDLNQYVKVEA